MKKKKKASKLTRSSNKAAYMFLLPWLIGFILFVAYPFFYTIYLSLFYVVRDVTGWTYEWIGLGNYEMAFFRNTTFNPLILDFVIVELTYVPAILVLSLILSLLLNTNIKFRAGFRMIYFFPVVVLSGPVMTQLINSDSTTNIDVTEIIVFRMIENFSPFLADMIGGIFNNFTLILWFTGIPIILFMNGLQKMNSQLYEAAQIDGANSWQILWKITLPNLKSTALVVAIFSVVQIAIFQVNPIYTFVVDTITSNYVKGLGFAAAIVLIYSVIVLIFVGIVFILLRDRDKVVYEESLRERKERMRLKMIKLQQQRNQKSLSEQVKDFFKKTTDKLKKKEVSQDDQQT
jgi:ABC-type sugar transport system permease subunit